MDNRETVDLKTYLIQFMDKHPECTIHVGCDSQNYANVSVYATTIVLRYPKKGAHVLYRKEKLKRINDMWSRLWNEIERSVELAQFIEDVCELPVHQVDLDFNEDPSFPSHKILNAASGYVTSLGFMAKAKPNLLMATWAANVLCH
tara:strand:+ start:1416 stop:1853 length:438 start_codon:yes stop_codon:yes gene_type:complete